MKEININLDLTNIEIEKDSKIKTGSELFIQWIENAIISSYTDEQGRSHVTEQERRKVYRLLDRLEEHQEGIISLSDENYQFMQDRWKNARFGAITLSKQFRILFKRIDEIILPDLEKEKQ